MPLIASVGNSRDAGIEGSGRQSIPGTGACDTSPIASTEDSQGADVERSWGMSYPRIGLSVIALLLIPSFLSFGYHIRVKEKYFSVPFLMLFRKKR